MGAVCEHYRYYGEECFKCGRTLSRERERADAAEAEVRRLRSERDEAITGPSGLNVWRAKYEAAAEDRATALRERDEALRERDAQEDRAIALYARATAAERERDEAREALREVQWGGEWSRGIGEEVEQTCPGCGRRRSVGHAEVCIVARALLGGGDAQKENEHA